MDRADWANFSSPSLNEAQLSPEDNSDLRSLFSSIVDSETLRSSSIYTIFGLLGVCLAITISLYLGLKHSQSRLTWNCRKVLLKYMTVSNLTINFGFALTTLYCLLWRETLNFNIVCLAQYFILTPAFIISLLSTTSMILERYLYVCHPAHYLRFMTTRRFFYCKVVVWPLSVILSGILTFLLIWESPEYGHRIPVFVCDGGSLQAQLLQSTYFVKFNNIIFGSLHATCFIMCIFSLVQIQRKAPNQPTPFKEDMDCAKTAIRVTLAIFLIQSLPSAISLFSNSGIKQIYVVMMVLSTRCINPMVSIVRNGEVRQALWRLWMKRKKQFFRSGASCSVNVIGSPRPQHRQTATLAPTQCVSGNDPAIELNTF